MHFQSGTSVQSIKNLDFFGTEYHHQVTLVLDKKIGSRHLSCNVCILVGSFRHSDFLCTVGNLLLLFLFFFSHPFFLSLGQCKPAKIKALGKEKVKKLFSCFKKKENSFYYFNFDQNFGSSAFKAVAQYARRSSSTTLRSGRS